jgi:3-oxoacyl-[acyl-carrier protein] reductase
MPKAWRKIADSIDEDAYMNERLKGKTAIVTGSGRGIGRSVALALAREGASLAVNDIIADSAQSTVDEIINVGGLAKTLPCDVSNFAAAQELIQRTVEEFGRLDILVNNAGSPNLTTNIWDIGEKDWDDCIDVFLKGSFNCLRHACGIMREQKWGRIINTTSVCWLGTPPHISYSSAKAGIIGLTNAAAREMGRYGITCNAYSPNAATPKASIGDEAQTFLKDNYEAGFLSKDRYNEMLNPPPPESIGPLIVYLCTDEAADTNGQVFDIWGGKISLFSAPEKKVSIEKENGFWTVDELIKQVPEILLKGYTNPAPAKGAQ